MTTPVNGNSVREKTYYNHEYRSLLSTNISELESCRDKLKSKIAEAQVEWDKMHSIFLKAKDLYEKHSKSATTNPTEQESLRKLKQIIDTHNLACGEHKDPNKSDKIVDLGDKLEKLEEVIRERRELLAREVAAEIEKPKYLAQEGLFSMRGRPGAGDGGSRDDDSQKPFHFPGAQA